MERSLALIKPESQLINYSGEGSSSRRRQIQTRKSSQTVNLLIYQMRDFTHIVKGQSFPVLFCTLPYKGGRQKLLRDGVKKSKWKFKMAFAMKGEGGSRGGLECHIPILKNDFFKNHLESFPDCENVFCT